jgi:ABC-2 type transport system ATP-binding protein
MDTLSAAATGVVIRVAGLTKRYGDLVAVDGIDFEVARGEVFGLLGPNGAGKTTTVEILEGLRVQDGGTATVLGLDVATDAEALKPRIGVSLQTAAMYPKLTVTEVIDLFRSFYVDPRPTQELIDALELGERRDARTAELSGGRRQRLGVALALVNHPELVFLDEPTTGLDPASRLTVWEELRRINAQGTTIFLTTQYLEEADQLCDRLAIIDGGLIVREGTPEQLKAELRQRRGLDADPTLDEVFLEATGRTRERLAGEVQEVSA